MKQLFLLVSVTIFQTCCAMQGDRNDLFLDEMIGFMRDQGCDNIPIKKAKKSKIVCGTIDIVESESGIHVYLVNQSHTRGADTKKDFWQDGREIQYNGIGNVIHIPLYHQKIIIYQDALSYDFTILWRQDKKGITTQIASKNRKIPFLLDLNKIGIHYDDIKKIMVLYFPKKQDFFYR